jgi:hypothetical protein
VIILAGQFSSPAGMSMTSSRSCSRDEAPAAARHAHHRAARSPATGSRAGQLDGSHPPRRCPLAAGWLITGAAIMVALLLARPVLPNARPAPAETVAPAADEFACRQLIEIVTDYLDGVLPPALREDFQTHIAACAGRDEYVRQISATIRALQAPDLQPIPTNPH